MRTATDILKDLAECKRREADLLCELAQASAQPIEVAEKPPLGGISPNSQALAEPKAHFKLARFLKGKFALTVWAACKLKAIIKADGGEPNMIEVANELGACLGIHFTEKEWKSTLEGNFHTKEPRSIFFKMEDVVWRRFLGLKRE